MAQCRLDIIQHLLHVVHSFLRRNPAGKNRDIQGSCAGISRNEFEVCDGEDCGDLLEPVDPREQGALGGRIGGIGAGGIGAIAN